MGRGKDILISDISSETRGEASKVLFTFKSKASERPPGVTTGISQTPAYREIGARTYLQISPIKTSEGKKVY